MIFASSPSVESLKAFSPTTYVGWNMSVPDQFRADFVISELKEYEAKGEFPNMRNSLGTPGKVPGRGTQNNASISQR